MQARGLCTAPAACGVQRKVKKVLNMAGMNTPSHAGLLTLLSREHVAMIDKGVSAIVSSCDAQLRPSIMRAVGSAISPDGRVITVYLVCQQSRQLLQDIAATGRVAVVFSEPSTHRTLQVKAHAASARPMNASDVPVLTRYLASMEREIALVGFAPALTRAMLAHRQDDVMAVSFEPAEAFDQTPGPRAGSPLGPGGAGGHP